MSLTDKIAEIEEEIANTKYNKATQHHVGKLKAKLAQLREEVVTSSSGPKGSGYGVRKAGDATVALVGLPSVGKSTLLKIIASLDTNFQGDLVFSKDYSLGYLEQEPVLNDEKTVLDVVKEGAAATVAILDEYNSINNQFGLPEVYENADKMQQLMDRQAQLQDEIDVANHSGPIKKPFHRMTIREIEYTVKYEKQQFNKSL